MVSSRKRYIVLFFSALALVVSLYIMKYGKGPHASLPGCSGDTDCSEITAGRWGQLAGIPVALYGVGGYAGLIVSVLLLHLKRMEPYRPALWSLMVIMSLTGVGFIAWLTGLQWLVIKHFCVYCMSAHAFGLVAFVILLRYAPVWSLYPHAPLRLGTPAALLLSLLVATHILVVPDYTVAYAASDLEFAEGDTGAAAYGGGSIQIGKKPNTRQIYVLDNNLNFDIYKVPFLGAYDAEHVVVELFDYNCPACRKVYHKLHEFMDLHEGRIAVVPLPVPMETDCNPDLKRTHPEFRNSCAYARYGMAVCAADRTKFPEFHAWMMEGGHAPPLEEARARAEALVGSEAFAAALEDEAVQAWIADGLNIYRYLKGKSLPKIIAKDTVISSAGISSTKLFRSLEEALGLQPVEK